MDRSKEVVIFLATSKDGYLSCLSALIADINNKPMSSYHYQMYVMSTTNETEIQRCIEYLKSQHKEFIISLNEQTCFQASLINTRLGYPSPSPLSIMYALNKYFTRSLIDEFEWYAGFNLDDEIDSWIKNVKSYPCMLKPTTLVAGNGAFKCNDEATLRHNVEIVRADSTTYHTVKEINSDTQKFLGAKEKELCTEFMVEMFIETQGTTIYQFCMEVFVTRKGKVIPYAIVEEFFFTSGMFLGHILPPLHFDGNFHRFEKYAINIGEKLYQLGFLNQFFDIEFWQFPDGTFRLIEINPRCSTSYHQLYLEYSGNELFNDVTSLMLHDKEPLVTPLSKQKEQWRTRREEYTMLAVLNTQNLGKASDLFNFDLLNKTTASMGTFMLVDNSFDHIMTEFNQNRNGTRFALYIVKGLWNEIVRSERDTRKQFYKDFSQSAEAKNYPDYFVEH